MEPTQGSDTARGEYHWRGREFSVGGSPIVVKAPEGRSVVLLRKTSQAVDRGSDLVMNEVRTHHDVRPMPGTRDGESRGGGSGARREIGGVDLRDARSCR